MALLTMNHTEQRSGGKRLGTLVLVNGIAVIPIAYGLKCIMALNGQCVAPVANRTFRRQFSLIPVQDQAAVWAGFGYLALGAFVYFSMCSDQSDTTPIWLRLSQATVRWGSLLMMLWFWNKAGNL